MLFYPGFAYVFLILLTSCSLFFNPIIPDELEPYVDAFIYEGAKRGVHVNKERIIVEFKSCYELGASARGGSNVLTRYKVKICEYRWFAEWNEDQRTYVMFHELGHAALGRGHRNDTVMTPDMGMRYVSIMADGKPYYTTHPEHNHFRAYYDEYMDELFK